MFVAFIFSLALFAVFAPLIIPTHYWNYIVASMFVLILLYSTFYVVSEIQNIYLKIKSRPKDWTPNRCKECGHLIIDKNE
jgi:hypothetical protein